MRLSKDYATSLVMIFAIAQLALAVVCSGCYRKTDSGAEKRDQQSNGNLQAGPATAHEPEKVGDTNMVIVDADLAYWGDDSISLCLLLQSPAVKVLGVTTTSGNVWAEQATSNVLRLLEVIEQQEIPVHPGLPSEVHANRLRYYQEVERLSWARDAYAGALGRGMNVPLENDVLPGGPPKLSPSKLSAPDFFIEQVLKFPGKVTILLFGPATNLAAAIRQEPRLAKQVAHVLFFGGAVRVPGNTTKDAEFNFWFDPESADVVLKAGLPLTLLPLDATDGKVFDDEMIKFFANRPGSPMTNFIKQYFENRLQRRKGQPIPIWDEALVGVFLDQSLILSAHPESIHVVLERGPDYGASRPGGKTNQATGKSVKVISQVDTKALHNLIYRLFSN